MSKTEVTSAVQKWFRNEARPLPWRENRTPYRVWVSEIMLQQTQVIKVIDYFNRFMARFQSIEELANAERDEVLSYWTGLGYYSRCVNMHKAAQKIVADHGGVFPSDLSDIEGLPGIGSYTAGAIGSFAFNLIAPVVDGNIARVLSRLYADETVFNTPAGKKHFEAMSLALAQATDRPAEFHEGIMELGAVVCKPTLPVCAACPLQTMCVAHKRSIETAFPVKIKKAARTELHGAFAVVGNDEFIWLERNEKSRLLANLYAPPHFIIEKSEDAQSAFSQLSIQYQLPAINESMKRISIVRQLTHRIFHLHGIVINASPADLPHGHWIKRSQLSHVGLSSAVKKLLESAQVLSLFMLLISGCATHKHSLAKTIVDEVALPGPSEAPPASAAQDASLRNKLIKHTLSAVGKKPSKVSGKSFRQDCSGTVRALFEQSGLTLRGARTTKRQSDSETLYVYADQVGATTTDDPRPGDLIFFKNTYDVNRNGKLDDGISHVGIVTDRDGDQVKYVHYSRGRIIKSDLRDMIRRRKKGAKSKTGQELFVGYGKFDLNDLMP